jgi:hypothetical protein
MGGCPASCNGDPTTCAPSADCESDAGDSGTTTDAPPDDTSVSGDSTSGPGDAAADVPLVKPDAIPSGDGSTGGGDGAFVGDQPNENGSCACRTAGGSRGDEGLALFGLGVAAVAVLSRRRRRR